MSISRAFRNARLAHTLNFSDAKTIEESVDTSGNTGDIIYDNNFVYIKTTDGWKRASISSFTGFLPSDISGLQLWLDASDASTLYDSASGGSLVAAGGSVARWEDKSGNGNHVTGSGMTRTASGQNSLDVISTANTGTRYLGMSVTASDWTVFVAYDSAQVEAGYLLDAQTGRLILSHYAGTGDVGVYDGAWNEVAPTVLSTPNLLTFRLQSGGTNSQVFRDGTQIGSNFSYTQTAIGGNVGFFQSKDGYPFLAGDAYEFLIYQGALTTSDQQTVENYLIEKWGIS